VVSNSPPSSLEEDEGFSDWTLLSRRKEEQMEHKAVKTHLNGSHPSKLQLCSSSAQHGKQRDLNVFDSTPFIQTRPPFSNQQNLDEDGNDEDCGGREQERMANIKAAEREEGEIRRWCAEEEDPRRMKGHESSLREKQNQSCNMDEKVQYLRRHLTLTQSCIKISLSKVLAVSASCSEHTNFLFFFLFHRETKR